LGASKNDLLQLIEKLPEKKIPVVKKLLEIVLGTTEAVDSVWLRSVSSKPVGSELKSIEYRLISECEEDLIKETFTWFGAAYYYSEVLYRELCNVYVIATFEKPENVTRPRVEEKLAFAFSLTLGQIIEKIKKFLPNDLQRRLESALDRRNYLAHHFWFERCLLMFSEQSLFQVRQELIELTDMFKTLDEDITKYFLPRYKTFGITDEIMKEAFKKILAGKPIEPLIPQRFPRKQERVVRAWNVKVSNNATTLIFETEDGCFWQLCDVGLGWTYFQTPGSDWQINEKIQKYLPADINPRPPIVEPWNYEFNLSKGTKLWVKRGKRERTYIWGIKAPLEP